MDSSVHLLSTAISRAPGVLGNSLRLNQCLYLKHITRKSNARRRFDIFGHARTLSKIRLKSEVNMTRISLWGKYALLALNNVSAGCNRAPKWKIALFRWGLRYRWNDGTELRASSVMSRMSGTSGNMPYDHLARRRSRILPPASVHR